jgi:hypothetical protein
MKMGRRHAATCDKIGDSDLLAPQLRAAAESQGVLFGDITEGLPGPVTISPFSEPRREVASLLDPANSMHRDLLVRACHSMKLESGNGGLAQQGAIHQFYGAHPRNDPDNDAHSPDNGRFLAWHRAFLYFHERILRWHLETRLHDPNAAKVRIPYWNAVKFDEIPSLYTGQSDLENNNCRTLLPQDPTTVTSATIQLSYGLQEPNVSKASSLIFTWHNMGHVFAGGNMQTLGPAAFDPLFFAWHSNVDRWWSLAVTEGARINDDFCAFFDPYTPGNWVRVNLKDYTSAGSLGVTWQAPPVPFRPIESQLPSLALSRIPLPASEINIFDFLISRGDDERWLARIPAIAHTDAPGMRKMHAHDVMQQTIDFIRLPLNEDDRALYSERGSSVRIRAIDTHAELVVSPTLIDPLF